MKVIDLIQKIANGEETPKKIKYKDIIFDYKKEKGDYEGKAGQFFLDWVELNGYGLHNEVEIIKEDKKIEKMTDFYEEQINENGSMSEPFNKHELKIISKINEIIDYLEENK